MIELVMTFCLLTAPDDCRVVRQPASELPFLCALKGQEVASEWLASHPEYRFTGWRCGRREVAL